MKVRSRFLCEVLVACVWVTATVRGDSLWRQSTAPSMFADHKAFGVGDIVTIIVQENSTATKNNETKTSKQSSMKDALQAFLYSPAGSAFLTKNGALPAMQYSTAHSFDGSGAINNNETIVDEVPVRVVDVLPNRNLVVEGARHTSFGGEQQDVVLHGVVRPDDITANNTVFSYNVADATIKIVSKGTVTNSQKKGWLMELWDKFSPF
ncbi:MAG TPA: flagellar basal body L-ring protein FlgH [Verrucomicrobiae bacterium]|nr:flagellar basal body L-ring protein FlgH [Verrucomicrobiae bacterium]